MNKKQKLFAGLLVLFLAIFFGASCAQDIIVPTYIEPNVMEYTNLARPVNGLYTSLYDAKRIQREIAHKLEWEKLTAKHANDDMQISIAGGEEIKDVVFDPTGPLAIMFPALAGLGLGRYLKSPREQELEKKANV